MYATWKILIRVSVCGIVGITLLASCNGNNLPRTPNTSDSHLSFSDFAFLKLDMSYDEIVAKVGEANRDIGSGIHLFVYELDDGTEMILSFASLDRLQAVYRYDPEEDVREVILGPE